MASYRVFRLKEHVRQNFRWSPHLSGLSQVKPRDYEEAFTVEGDSPYAVWAAGLDTPRALQVGDVIEIDGFELRIVKYVGFEQARWLVPEEKQVGEPEPAAAAATGP